ncbi:MAG TPA: hypothetical protein VEX11_17210 [Acetobacteraceae bacterium]|jgi:hypothetical protein|nr:hypothetical protein [Acetobacteraceae bacterium]
MPLLDFWKSASATVEQLTIEQVVSSAGDGVLKDDSSCSAEFRKYLTEIPVLAAVATTALVLWIDRRRLASAPGVEDKR